MSAKQQVVDRYMDAFQRSDHETILACLTDDVVWHIHGFRTTHGKPEFDDEIEDPAFEGSPQLSVDRIIEDGDTVVVTGEGIAHHRENGRFRFAYNDLFTFRSGLIAQVDSYVVPLHSDRVQLEIADLVRTGTADLGEAPSARQVLETICEAFLPVDERRRRAMLVFLSFGTAALTDESLQGPAALRRGQGLVDVLAEQLLRQRSDEHVDDDALLLLMAVVGLGNGILAGDITVEQGRRLLARAIDRALSP